MHHINKKIKNNKGASILIALQLMLICIMVSSVIIFAAATGSSRNIERKKKQQCYFAVTSAAELLKKELTGADESQNMKVKFVSTKTVPGCMEYDTGTEQTRDFGGTSYTGYPLPRGIIPNALDAFLVKSSCREENGFRDDSEAGMEGIRKAVQRAALKIYKKEYTNDEKKTYTEEFTVMVLKEDAVTADERSPKVTCILTMNEEYNAQIELKCADSNYTVKLVLPVNAVNIEQSESNGGECSHDVIYEKKQADDTYAPAKANYDFAEKVYTTTMIIKWGTPKVSKGVNI